MMAGIISEGLWEPPADMEPAVMLRWRAFYSKAMDTYGVVPRDYRRLYIAQKGRCWICRKAKGIHPDDPKGRGARRLGIDHDHVTGELRGLLCSGGDKTCNRVIGWLDHAALQRAVAYLENPPARVLSKGHGWSMRDMPFGPIEEAQLDILALNMLWPHGETP